MTKILGIKSFPESFLSTRPLVTVALVFFIKSWYIVTRMIICYVDTVTSLDHTDIFSIFLAHLNIFNLWFVKPIKVSLAVISGMPNRRTNSKILIKENTCKWIINFRNTILIRVRTCWDITPGHLPFVTFLNFFQLNLLYWKYIHSYYRTIQYGPYKHFMGHIIWK